MQHFCHSPICFQKKLSALQEAEQEKADRATIDAILKEMKAKVAKGREVDRYFKQALKQFLVTR